MSEANELQRLVGRLRALEDDHAPDGWPAVQMRDISALLDALEALIEDRARFPDKPDGIGRMIQGHIGSLKAGKKAAEERLRWADIELRSRMAKPPCIQCGAMNQEEAETRCICNGDQDHCHGCELWPDGEYSEPPNDLSSQAQQERSE